MSFNSLSCKTNYKRLEAYKIGEETDRMDGNYLGNGKQQVSINGEVHVSELYDVTYGIPQGLLLGPPLFVENSFFK